MAKSRLFLYVCLAALLSAVAFASVFDSGDATPVAADSAENASLAEQLQNEFAAVAAKVNPTVVNIDVAKPAQMPQGFQFFGRPRGQSPLPPGFEEFFNRRPQGPPGKKPSEVPQRRGVGSGVIIDAENGYILTNNHVISDATEIGATLIDGTRYEATLVGADPRTDIAVIQIKAKGLKEIEWGDSDKLQPGHWVLAFGQPQGLGYTVTKGIVSAKGRMDLHIIGSPGGITGYENFIQTDAAVNPGNSGGPLTDIKGRLVGINTAIATNGMSPQFMGISFAIPSKLARTVSRKLIEKGEVVRGWLGVTIGDLKHQPDDIKAAYGKDISGVYVADVTAGQPADKGGLEPGDVVTQFGDAVIDDVQALRNLVAETPVGEKAKIKVIRLVDEKPTEVTLTVKIGKQPASFAEIAGGPPVVTSAVGVAVQTLTPDMAQHMGYDEDEKGAVVTSVAKGSRAEAADIKSGDLITAVTYKGKAFSVESADDLSKALSSIPEDDSFLVNRKRAGQAKIVTVK